MVALISDSEALNHTQYSLHCIIAANESR